MTRVLAPVWVTWGCAASTGGLRADSAPLPCGQGSNENCKRVRHVPLKRGLQTDLVILALPTCTGEECLPGQLQGFYFKSVLLGLLGTETLFPALTRRLEKMSDDGTPSSGTARGARLHDAAHGGQSFDASSSEWRHPRRREASRRAKIEPPGWHECCTSDKECPHGARIGWSLQRHCF